MSLNKIITGLTLLLLVLSSSVMAQNLSATTSRSLDLDENFDASDDFPAGWHPLVNNVVETGSGSRCIIFTAGYQAHTPNNFAKMIMTDEIDASVMLVSPEVTDFDTKTLKFWSKCSPQQSNTIVVGLLTDSEDNATFTAIQEFNLTEEYEQYVLNIETELESAHLAFKFGNVSAEYTAVYVDDILYREFVANIPLKTDAKSPVWGASNVLATPNLQWEVAEREPTGYRLYLGTDYPPTNVIDGLELDGEFNTTYQITEALEYLTDYYWQVVPFNDTGDAEDNDIWMFSTQGEPVIDEFPWFEDFNSYAVSEFPVITGWSKDYYSTYEMLSWTVAHSNESFENMAHSEPAYMNFPTFLSYASDSWLYSPAIEMEAGHTYKVSFWYRTPNTSGEDVNEKMELKWGTNPDRDAMFNKAIFKNEEITSTTWTKAEGTVVPENDGRFFLGFHCYSDSGQDMLSLDDVQVEDMGLGIEDDINTPADFSVMQNYPNPFNPETKINYNLPANGMVNISIFNASGQKVATLVNGMQKAGNNKFVSWKGMNANGRQAGSGIYFYSVSFGNKVITKKMILNK